MAKYFESTKNCMECGTELKESAKRCYYCGSDPDEKPEYTEADLGIDPYDY